jgi:nucleotide-binding universal stress UspA family protein
MVQLDHILVCLDLTDMDDSLIRYSNFLLEKFKPESITFLHVMKSYEIPREMIEAFPHLEKPLTDVVEEDIREKIDTFFVESKETKTIINVTEGLTTETIVRYTREKNISLTVMGKKIGYEGQGRIVRKIIGIIPSSILLISESSHPRIEQVLVRMDFSKMSELALRMALKIKALTGTKITCHHVYKLPLEYFPQGAPEKDLRLLDHVDRYSQKEYKKFLKKYRLEDEDISFTNSLDPENDEALILYKQALAIGADIILTGSKIKSELASIIVDSTSEKLMATEKNIPVLIVKDRRQSIGFLKALFK